MQRRFFIISNALAEARYAGGSRFSFVSLLRRICMRSIIQLGIVCLLLFTPEVFAQDAEFVVPGLDLLCTLFELALLTKGQLAK